MNTQLGHLLCKITFLEGRLKTFMVNVKLLGVLFGGLHQ